ncbi:hypothetical protein [Anaeromyxobacter dehalogenans]|uniref:Uncharacterized protein n=1 Tax=Anaeromyxobacter dehalogenans (strain 2CP-C) TaxID=290397 RepID=Q2IJ16_ANADE|nr:hypothetical protein [Anaeromyxobacter dehalogenans]ABC81645.1 hypothetical protein Adeh_1874 [Anaeromyxobacter dehalogenans 2CP-C]
MTAKTKKPEAFAHAADLPAAYRELKAAVEAVIVLEEESGPLLRRNFHLPMITGLSMVTIWQQADERAAAHQRLAAAARRVQVALHGKKEARRWTGFVPDTAEVAS